MSVPDDVLITEELAEEINSRAQSTRVPSADRRQLEAEAGVGKRQADFWFAHSKLARSLVPVEAYRPEKAFGPRLPGRFLSEIEKNDPGLAARVRVGLALVGGVTQVPTQSGGAHRVYHERFQSLDEANQRIAQMKGEAPGFDPYLEERWVNVRLREADPYDYPDYPWELEVEYDDFYEDSSGS